MHAPWLDEADLHHLQWRAHDLVVGESITGRVVRLPSPGALNGTRVFIATPDEVFGIHATAKHGATVLERELAHVEHGDIVTITLHGWRSTLDGERRYRYFTVERS